MPVRNPSVAPRTAMVRQRGSRKQREQWRSNGAGEMIHTGSSAACQSNRWSYLILSSLHSERIDNECVLRMKKRFIRPVGVLVSESKCHALDQAPFKILSAPATFLSQDGFSDVSVFISKILLRISRVFPSPLPLHARPSAAPGVSSRSSRLPSPHQRYP